MLETNSSVDQLERRLQTQFLHIRKARELAVLKRAELRTALAVFDSEDTSIVVSGSLARNEFTADSDIDWTLLVDGSADPQHYDLTGRIKKVVSGLSVKETGAEGTFSTMVFSHNLIHEIGGEDDTNSNTTRRLLLLLESCPIGRDEAYQNVTRNILNRYLLEDRGFWKGSRYRVPRFLQNDFARYWRTMGVDFAYKLRTRSGKGWAIRNIKLRMSRKLIYVSGMLACFRCHVDHTPEEWNEFAESIDRRGKIVEYFGGVFQETPLEIIAHELLRYPHLDDAARKIFDSYNEFLGMLASSEQRNHLEFLVEEDAESDDLFQKARGLSHTFRDGLLEFFFDNKSGMDKLTKNYGVF